jgi:hypothetical protein
LVDAIKPRASAISVSIGVAGSESDIVVDDSVVHIIGATSGAVKKKDVKKREGFPISLRSSFLPAVCPVHAVIPVATAAGARGLENIVGSRSQREDKQ